MGASGRPERLRLTEAAEPHAGTMPSRSKYFDLKSCGHGLDALLTQREQVPSEQAPAEQLWSRWSSNWTVSTSSRTSIEFQVSIRTSQTVL